LALEEVFDEYQLATDREYKDSLLMLLANMGIQDRRVRSLIETTFFEEPEFGAILIGSYEDKSFLPILYDRAKLLAPKIKITLPIQGLKPYHREWIEICDAIRVLEGDYKAYREWKEKDFIEKYYPSLKQKKEIKKRIEEYKRTFDKNKMREQVKKATDEILSRFIFKKTGRNDPCPCGSQRKYKKCCLGQEHLTIVHHSVFDSPKEL